MKRFLFILALLPLATLTGWGQYRVEGVVEDEDGPAIGVSIVETGTSNGVSTDLDGAFVLLVSGPDAQLEISGMGYATQTFRASALPARILMELDSNLLEEVVVVGYGTQKSKDLTAPITNVKGDVLSRQVAANPMSALQGMVSGVQITRPSRSAVSVPSAITPTRSISWTAPSWTTSTSSPPAISSR